MKCSEVERALPELLDGASQGAFPSEVEHHLQACPECSGLVTDIERIASEAGQLAVSEEPPQRVWVRIAAELRAEGIIKDPVPSDSARPVHVPRSSPRRWSIWWLAPVAAGLLAAGSYVVSHRPVAQVAQQVPAAPVLPFTPRALAPLPIVVPQAPVMTASADSAPDVARPQKSNRAPLESAPSPEEDAQFLSAVSTRAPAMRATYERQLKAVNADIRETQEYLNRNPGDAEARQHLMDAYQQKALLYQLALERIQ